MQQQRIVSLLPDARQISSISVGTTTRQDTHDVDDPCLGITLEAHAPVAHAQTPFVGVCELDDISSRWIVCQPVKSTNDATLGQEDPSA